MNHQQQKLLKVFIVLFVFGYFIINWDDVSWIFNYKELNGLAYDFFNPYQDSSLLVSAQEPILMQQPAVKESFVLNNNDIKTPAPVAINYIDANNNYLSIPSIGVSTAVMIGESTDVALLEKDLDKGAVYYPGSVMPGDNGQMVILGHSAPPNWPHIKHDYIFSDINNLNSGDTMVLHFNNTEYTYRVIGKTIINKGQDIPFVQSSATNNILTLVSCWPPGRNYKRIAVQAELTLH